MTVTIKVMRATVTTDRNMMVIMSANPYPVMRSKMLAVCGFQAKTCVMDTLIAEITVTNRIVIKVKSPVR